MEYLSAINQAMLEILQPVRVLWLIIGIFLGMACGVLPGFGATVGIAVLLPFMFGMDPINAVFLLVGIQALSNTSDSIPAVLLAVPPGGSSTASVLEGYRMTQRGEAGRALGAAFSASALGGVFGAIVLFAAIPVARPIMRMWLSPEYFMLCVTGVVLVSGLTGKNPLKGLFAGAIGLMLSVVGGAPGTGHYRFTFDLPYLVNGIPLLVLILGAYALPELADLFLKGTRIADVPKLPKGQLLTGYQDTLKNWWLVIRCSAIGAWVGFAPGVGGAAASWLAYAHCVSSEKNGQWGKGDVRGLIAPEASNNAVKGGDLIPTLTFGIPGSSSMAIFMGALMILGVTPGPQMIEKNLSFVMIIVISLALSNVLGCFFCSLLVRPIAAVSQMRVYYLVPFILMFVLLGAYQATHNWGDLTGVLLIGLLSWTMKRLGYPRPPLVIGFVLGGLMDTYLWISYAVMGWTWLYRPWVLVLLAVSLFSVYLCIPKKKRKKLVVEGVRVVEGEKED